MEFGDEIPSALELVSIPSYILDPAGVVAWLNLAAGRRLGDIRGRRFSAIVAPEDRRRWRELRTHKLAGHGAAAENQPATDDRLTTQDQPVRDDELVLLDPDGNRVRVECSWVPLVRAGQAVGLFGQLRRAPAAAPAAPHPRLTPRQSEILRLLERGHSTQQIAEDLHLSRETVRNHVRHVLRALGVHSRLEAVAAARLTSTAL